MSEPAEKLPPLPTPTHAAEGFKRTRAALGVGAYTAHIGLPAFMIKIGDKMAGLKLRNTDSELTPAKKRERILIGLVVALALFYAYGELSRPDNQLVGDTSQIDVLMQDPSFMQTVETVKKELNQIDMTPEVYREALRRRNLGQ